jgi:hypothetical protein
MTTPSTYKLGYPKLEYSLVPMASGAPFQRDPTSSDLKDPKVGNFYKIGTVWPNEATNAIWMLASITGGTTANWVGISAAATGDVVGPASATDNAIARFNTTTGKLIQNSLGIISDTGVLTGLTQIGIGIAPTALLGLAAGTATAGTAPLKFALGVNLTSPEAGAVEYNGTVLTYTDSVPTRNTLAVGPGTSTSNGLVSWSSTTGYKLLSNTPTISAGVITYPANGGNVLTAGTRKGTGSFTGGNSGAIATTAAVTGCVISIMRTNLAGAAAALGEYVTINTGVSFTVISGDAADTSAFNWVIVG